MFDLRRRLGLPSFTIIIAVVHSVQLVLSYWVLYLEALGSIVLPYMGSRKVATHEPRTRRTGFLLRSPLFRQTSVDRGEHFAMPSH